MKYLIHFIEEEEVLCVNFIKRKRAPIYSVNHELQKIKYESLDYTFIDLKDSRGFTSHNAQVWRLCTCTYELHNILVTYFPANQDKSLQEKEETSKRKMQAETRNYLQKKNQIKYHPLRWNHTDRIQQDPKVRPQCGI